MDSIILTFLSYHLHIYGIWVASFRWNWGAVEEVLWGALALLIGALGALMLLGAFEGLVDFRCLGRGQ